MSTPTRRFLITLVALSAPVLALAAPVELRVAKFAGDRAAAISYTFDDGLRDQYTVAAPMLDEVGFKATFFVIPGRVSETVADAERRQLDKRAWGTITWDELKKLSANGHEIGSHTWSHPGLGKLTPAQVDEEFTKASDSIKTHLGSAPLTIAFPFNQSTPEIKEAALKHHVAFRSYQAGTGGDKTNAEWFARWTDKQVADKSWGVLMIHGVSQGYAALTDPQVFHEHLRKVKARETEIWVDTFANVARYAKERDDAKLAVIERETNSVKFTVTGTLDAAIYTVPLTVVIDATNAKSARAVRVGKELPVRVSPSAVQVDAAPSAEPIVVTWR